MGDVSNMNSISLLCLKLICQMGACVHCVLHHLTGGLSSQFHHQTKQCQVGGQCQSSLSFGYNVRGPSAHCTVYSFHLGCCVEMITLEEIVLGIMIDIIDYTFVN